jgi:hypothetical protein
MTNTLAYYKNSYITEKNYNIGPCGLYYKHMTIVNNDSSVVNKLEDLLTDDARGVIYDRHMLIIHTTDLVFWSLMQNDIFRYI